MLNNHDAYIPDDLAILLRNAGFNWEINTYYLRQRESDGDYIKYKNKFDLIENQQFIDWNNNPLTMSEDGLYIMRVSAPTIDVAQRWLREIYNLHIGVIYDRNKEPYPFSLILNVEDCPLFDESISFIFFNNETKGVEYSSFESALCDGIKTYVNYIIPAKLAAERLKNGSNSKHNKYFWK